MTAMMDSVSKPREPEWMFIEEVAALSRTPVNSMYMHNSRGTGPPRYKVGKRLLYRRSEVIAWIESGRIESGQPQK